MITTMIVYRAYAREVTIFVLFTCTSSPPEGKPGDRALCKFHNGILTGTVSWHSLKLFPIGLRF